VKQVADAGSQYRPVRVSRHVRKPPRRSVALLSCVCRAGGRSPRVTVARVTQQAKAESELGAGAKMAGVDLVGVAC